MGLTSGATGFARGGFRLYGLGELIELLEVAAVWEVAAEMEPAGRNTARPARENVG